MSLSVDDVLMRPLFFWQSNFGYSVRDKIRKAFQGQSRYAINDPYMIKLRRNDYYDNQLRMFTVVAILSHAGIRVLASICVISSFLVLRNFFTYSLYIYEKFTSTSICKKKLSIVINLIQRKYNYVNIFIQNFVSIL